MLSDAHPAARHVAGTPAPKGEKRTLAGMVEERLLATFRGYHQDDPAGVDRVRSRAQVIADLCIDILLLILWGVLLYLNASSIRTYLGSVRAAGTGLLAA